MLGRPENDRDYELSPNMEIRKMTEDDLDQVIAIEQQCFTDPWSRQGFIDSIKQTFSVMLVGSYLGRICGYCCLYQMLDEGEIINVAVHPGIVKMGWGKRLVSMVMKIGIEKGVSCFCWMCVWAMRLQFDYMKKWVLKNCSSEKFYQFPTEDGWLMRRNANAFPQITAVSSNEISI